MQFLFGTRRTAINRPVAEFLKNDLPDVVVTPTIPADQQAEIKSLERQLADQKKAIDQLQVVVKSLVRRHYFNLPLPPNDLRMHVGTNDTPANFWAQGMNSSDRVLKLFGEEPRGPILDWGCGSGRTMRWLLHYPAWQKQYRGCDVDAEAIAWIGSQATINLGSQVQVCQIDPPLPYEAGSLTGLYSFSVLTHIHPTKHGAWYAEFARILSPGSVAYITTHGPSIAQSQAQHYLAQFRSQGWCYVQHPGQHYKDAAIVSEEFTRRICEEAGLTVESYAERGYQNMDALILRRRA